MEPAVLGSKLASGLVGQLVRKLFRPDGPGAGLVDKPVRLSALVSFRGEQRTLGEKQVHALARSMVRAAVDSPGEPPFPAEEEAAVTDALTRQLLALGDLDMNDVQAVRLGYRELARKLRHQAPPTAGLSADACYFLDNAIEWACLQILEFFTRRSTFVARTLVEQTRAQTELIAKIDELLARSPRPGAQDRTFERRYLPYVTDRHNHITIYGIDLRDSPDRWPLEVAYLSLEATAPDDRALPEDRPGTVRVTVQLPAEEALLTHDRVLLRGDAGSGKTTLVQWLAVTAAREATHIPYVLPLRTLIRTGSLPAPADFLTQVSCPLSAPEGWTERVLTAGRGLVLVDGLDEIPAADRHRTRDWLLALIHAYPGNRWLLTSRPTAVRPDWLATEGFRELTLAPMRRADVSTFVHRWHTAARAPEYEGPLLDSLRTKRDLARLATNPLMCGLICALHRERRGYLPTGRKELYDAALTMLLSRRDRERGMGAVAEVELGAEAQLELLQRLAYALVLSGRTEMDRATAEGMVDRCLPTIGRPGDAATVLRSLLLRSGLLRQPADGTVDFVHRTFQDYLGARYAVEEGHLDVLTSHADDTQWEDVIRMAVAHARPRERASLIRQLLLWDTPRLTLLALACLEHAATLDPQVRAEVEQRAGALIPPRSAEDAKALAEAGPLVLELLPGPAGLTDEEALNITITASALGSEEPEGALGVLRQFRGHPHLDVLRQLVGTWGRFPTDQYAAEVLDHLDHEDLYITCESAEQRAALAGMRPWTQPVLPGRPPRRGDRGRGGGTRGGDAPPPDRQSGVRRSWRPAGLPLPRGAVARLPVGVRPRPARPAASRRPLLRGDRQPQGDGGTALATTARGRTGASRWPPHRCPAGRLPAGTALPGQAEHEPHGSARAGALDESAGTVSDADERADSRRLAGGGRIAPADGAAAAGVDLGGRAGRRRSHTGAGGRREPAHLGAGRHRGLLLAGAQAAGTALGDPGEPDRVLRLARPLGEALPRSRGGPGRALRKGRRFEKHRPLLASP
ncbi:hypothetical protein M2158_009537 [Streptomyces sp. SAI-144]|nr:hypothetical protein [Streptomyces sp. SAI-144]